MLLVVGSLSFAARGLLRVWWLFGRLTHFGWLGLLVVRMAWRDMAVGDVEGALVVIDTGDVGV